MNRNIFITNSADLSFFIDCIPHRRNEHYGKKKIAEVNIIEYKHSHF